MVKKLMGNHIVPVKIGQGAECGLNCFVPARFTANRPGYARIAGLAGDQIIAALAVSMTNRMNRRKINHVEAHCFGVVDT